MDDPFEVWYAQQGVTGRSGLVHPTSTERASAKIMNQKFDEAMEYAHTAWDLLREVVMGERPVGKVKPSTQVERR